MALQTNFRLDDGTEFTNTYLQIKKYSGDGGRGELLVYIWKDETDKTLNLPPIQTRWYSFEYDLESPDNILIQGYDYLKTCPEFINSIDI